MKGINMSNTAENNEVSLNVQYIKDMSLEIPHAPEIFSKLTATPQIGIDLNIDVKKSQNNQYEVVLNIRINANIEKEPLFIFELAYAALCTANIPEEQKEPVLFIEIPTLLFPYARQIISSNLAEAGLPPLFLTPIDFATVYKNKKNSTIKSM